MKLFICASKHHYHKIPEIIPELESAGHVLAMPNSYYEPFKEESMKAEGADAHTRWKRRMMEKYESNILPQDGVLVLNFEKNIQKNYISSATLLEIHTAFRLWKKIFLYNPIPEGIFADELRWMNPTVSTLW